MSQIFNADEVFAIGVQIEKNGRDFYLSAKNKIQNSEIQKLLEELARWEGEHINFFEQLRKSLPNGAGGTIENDSDGLIYLYLKSFADNKVFKNKTNVVNECRSILDILNKALDFERESVVLYSSMKEIVPENLGKEQIDKLISEELRHVALLTREIENLKGE